MEKLKVPENIPLRWELWHGIGKKECILLSCIAAVTIPLAYIYAQASTNVLAPLKAVTGVILALFVAVLFLQKLEYNQSILDYIKKIYRYRHEQQIYFYQYEEDILPYAQKKER